MTCHITAQPSLQCSTVTISYQPRRAQCGGGECCRLQDDLYCFLGKLQESTIARAVTRHGHTHLVCRWFVVLSDALLLGYTFCIVAVLLDSLDMNLHLGTWRLLQCFFYVFMVYWYWVRRCWWERYQLWWPGCVQQRCRHAGVWPILSTLATSAAV